MKNKEKWLQKISMANSNLQKYVTYKNLRLIVKQYIQTHSPNKLQLIELLESNRNIIIDYNDINIRTKDENELEYWIGKAKDAHIHVVENQKPPKQSFPHITKDIDVENFLFFLFTLDESYRMKILPHNEQFGYVVVMKILSYMHIYI